MNPNDINQPSDEQLRNRDLAASGQLDSSMLQSVPSADFQQPQAPSIYDVSTIELTAPEKQAESEITDIQKLTQSLVGESAFRGEQEKTADFAGMEKSQQDLTNQLKALQAEAKAIPLSIQQEFAGRGVTKGGVAPIEAGRLRENAIKALTVSSLLEASRGNLTLAQDQIDRAVSQKFDPIREQINAKMFNLDLIMKSPAYSVAEKNRAQKQQFEIQKQQQALDSQKGNYEIAQAMAAAAVKLNSGNQAAMLAARQVQALNPADPAYLQKVYGLLGQYQADPAQMQKDLDAHLIAQQKLESGFYDIEKVKEDLKNAPLERKRLEADIARINADTSLTPLRKKQLEADIAKTYSDIAETNQKVADLKITSSPQAKQAATAGLLNIANTLLESPYLSSITGVKSPGAIGIPFTEKTLGSFYGSPVQETLNQFNQLKASLSLENRQKLKGSGAISDFESKVLEKSASSLGTNLSNEAMQRQLRQVRGVLATASGNTAEVKITDPKTGQTQTLSADQAGITSAINDGLTVEYQ